MATRRTRMGARRSGAKPAKRKISRAGRSLRSISPKGARMGAAKRRQGPKIAGATTRARGRGAARQGPTVDNMITNRLVAEGLLPPSRLEIFPQGARSGPKAAGARKRVLKRATKRIKRSVRGVRKVSEAAAFGGAGRLAKKFGAAVTEAERRRFAKRRKAKRKK